MRAIDIYNFRRKLAQCNFHNIDTASNIITELIDLRDSIEFIVNSWTRSNIDRIKYEEDKTIQS
jgi:hypothetical protein